MKVVSVIWAILRGLLWALADEFPLGGRKKPAADKKESPWWAERPEAERPADRPAAEPNTEAPAPDKPAAPTWWPEPAPPAAPPTIKVETDAGTFIASTTFSGQHVMGVKRVERPRQEGESRRRRRVSRPAMPGDVAVELREPELPAAAAVADPSPVTRADVELQPAEPAVPVAPAIEAAQAEGAATPIDPSEAPRVARARRVRGRFGAADQPGSNLLATTLATRLALSAATCGSPPPGASAARRASR